MATNETTIRSRIDPVIKRKAERVLKSMGLSMSEAIRLFLHQVVIEKALPLAVKAPNARTVAAMKAVDKDEGLSKVTIDQLEQMKETELTVSPNALAQRFQRLAKIWREECAHLSSIREMVLHHAYQQIVGIGSSALPFILKELECKPDHWFWALRSITGEDPVPPGHRGNVTQMAQDWLHWADRKRIRY